MKANTYNKDFKINEILENYQIPDLRFFEDYLSEIFIDLADKNQKNDRVIGKYIFSKYFEIYGIFLDRLFKILDRDDDGVLNKIEFIFGIKILYCQGTSFKSLTKFIFKLYDFNQDGKINKDDVKLLLNHIFLSNKGFEENFENINQFQLKLKKIIDFSFQEKNEIDFNDFSYIIENICSDIFIYILMFLLEKRPFSDETIFVYLSEKNNSPNLLELSMKYQKLDTKIKSPILNIKSISNHKKTFNFNKLLLQTDNNLFNLDTIYNKIKNNIIFHEGLIFKFAKDENNKINKIKKIFFRIIGKDLYYYKKSDIINHKGINNLTCSFVKKGEDVVINEIKYFSIIINYYKKEKIYYFDNIENRNIWLEKLRDAIGQKNIENKYNISKKILGEGTFSSVISGTNIKTNQNVAIKIINKKSMDTNELELVMNELYIMKICRHPYIIKLFDIYETNNKIYIVMEQCKKCNLFDYFIDKNYKMKEDIVKEIIYELLSAIKYIHSLGIIHRDIKLDNILFSNESKINIRLIDFGLSKILGPNEKSTDCCGTLAFAAPELLEEKPYTKSVDFWSLGIVTYFLLCGYLPFNGEIPEEVLIQIIDASIPFKENIWKNISVEAKDFVEGLLKKNPAKRFNIEQILQHPWIKSLKNPSKQ